MIKKFILALAATTTIACASPAAYTVNDQDLETVALQISNAGGIKQELDLIRAYFEKKGVDSKDVVTLIPKLIEKAKAQEGARYERILVHLLQMQQELLLNQINQTQKNKPSFAKAVATAIVNLIAFVFYFVLFVVGIVITVAVIVFVIFLVIALVNGGQVTIPLGLNKFTIDLKATSLENLFSIKEKGLIEQTTDIVKSKDSLSEKIEKIGSVTEKNLEKFEEEANNVIEKGFKSFTNWLKKFNK